MKKWIIPVLALTLAVAAVPSPSQAWPWDRKDNAEKNKASQNEAITPAMASSTESAPEATMAPAMAAPMESAPATVSTPRVQVKSPLSTELDGLKVEDPVESPELPPDKTYVTVDDPANPLGITTSAQILNTGAQMISQKKYKEAEQILTPLKDWLVDATEAHINLHKTLKNVPSAQVQAELEKQLALQFALLRDKAFFQLGMLRIGTNDYSGAIKDLSRVVQSQPRSPMGAQAYDVLQKIGFTEKIQLREEKKTSPSSTGPSAP